MRGGGSGGGRQRVAVRAGDRLKVEYSIIDGQREILEQLLAASLEVGSVIPGVVRPVRDARGKVRAAGAAGSRWGSGRLH